MIIVMKTLVARSRDLWRMYFSYFLMQQMNKQRNRRSIRDSRHFKSCSSRENNTSPCITFSESTHGPRLGNTLTIDGSWIRSGKNWRSVFVKKKGKKVFVDDSYVVYCQTTAIIRKVNATFTSKCWKERVAELTFIFHFSTHLFPFHFFAVLGTLIITLINTNSTVEKFM